MRLKPSLDFVEDTFDTSLTYVSDSTCILCHGGQDVGRNLHAKLQGNSLDLLDSSSSDEESTDRREPISLDLGRIWMSNNPVYVTSLRSEFVHFYCALFAPASWFKKHRWCNVAREVRRSYHFTCAHCGLKGATLGCMNSRCNFCVHLPCALELGWTPSLMNKSTFVCPAHRLEAETNRIERNTLELHDLSLGREAVELVAESSCFQEVQRLPYIYISKNVDSDDTSSSGVHIKSIRHCSCSDGMCNKVPTTASKGSKVALPCSCTGKNTEQYFRVGPYRCLTQSMMEAQSAAPAAVHERTAELDRIYECGLRCSCSSRVVGNGIQFRFKVKKKHVDSFSHQQSHSKRSKGPSPPSKAARIGKDDCALSVDSRGLKQQRNRNFQWALVTLEDIPCGAFVCEWTGQYVTGGTKAITPTNLLLRNNKLESRATQLTVLEDIIDSGVRSRGCDALGRIVPVDLWESPFSVQDTIGWMEWLSQRPLAGTSFSPSTSSRLAISHTTEHEDGSDMKDISLNSSSSSKKRIREDQTDTSLSEQLDTNGHESFLNSMRSRIYVDSRYYGNMSRFISVVNDASSANLVRRCVFVGDDGSNKYPRLALFAREAIPAGTELKLF